jgi:TonB family protein
MYYLDANLMKMAQPPIAAPATSPSPSPANNVVSGSSETKGPALASKSTISSNSSQNFSLSLPRAMITSNKLNTPDLVEVGDKSNVRSQPLMVQVDSEPPPPPAPNAILKPVSGGVLNGTALSLPSPYYPESAKRMRISGVVAVEVIVDEAGKVMSAKATSGPATLRDVAVQAAQRARFSPTKLSGQPVRVSGMINYKFALAE